MTVIILTAITAIAITTVRALRPVLSHFGWV
jgi:hypothetical protein